MTSKCASYLTLVIVLAILLLGMPAGLYVVLRVPGHLALQVSIFVLLHSQLDGQILLHVRLVLSPPVQVIPVRNVIDEVILAALCLSKVCIHDVRSLVMSKLLYEGRVSVHSYSFRIEGLPIDRNALAVPLQMIAHGAELWRLFTLFGVRLGQGSARFL